MKFNPFPFKSSLNLMNHGFNNNQLIIIDPLNYMNNVSQSTYKYILLETVFASGFVAITQICHCEIEKLHQNMMEMGDKIQKDQEIQLCIEKNSLLEKFFKSDTNKLYQMTKEGFQN